MIKKYIIRFLSWLAGVELVPVSRQIISMEDFALSVCRQQEGLKVSGERKRHLALAAIMKHGFSERDSAKAIELAVDKLDPK